MVDEGFGKVSDESGNGDHHDDDASECDGVSGRSRCGPAGVNT
jgi:hypothetical protein